MEMEMEMENRNEFVELIREENEKGNYRRIADIIRKKITNESEIEINFESEMKSENGLRIGNFVIHAVNGGSFLVRDECEDTMSIFRGTADEVFGRTFAAFIG